MGINLPTPNKGLKPLAECPNGREISAKENWYPIAKAESTTSGNDAQKSRLIAC
jgi:hypothetical protein